MERRAAKRARFRIALVLVLFSASEAHAQRIPDVAIWSAGAGLLAPLAAVPIKLGILRLMALGPGASRLWQIAAIEWVLWFPAAFIALRSEQPSSVPLTILALFGLATWLHKVRVAGARWRSALILSLPTPVLAVLLPLVVLASASWWEALVA